MKRHLDIVKNNETDSLLSMQDEDARKLLASRERLLALNAIFDAALMGESGKGLAQGLAKDMAKENYLARQNNDCLSQQLLDDETTTEH